MSVAGLMLEGYRASLRLLLPETCTRQTAASNWTASSSCKCLVEQSSPTPGSTLDAEIGNGHGYTVRLLPDQAMDDTDRILCAVGTLEVIRVSPTATLDGVRVAECVKR